MDRKLGQCRDTETLTSLIIIFHSKKPSGLNGVWELYIPQAFVPNKHLSRYATKFCGWIYPVDDEGLRDGRDSGSVSDGLAIAAQLQ